VYFGLVIIDKPTNAKLSSKHGITSDQVKDAIQWPAHPRAKWEDHPQHGRRAVAVGQTEGKPVLCILKPVPEHDENADTWEVKTARWLRQS
jgi:hypothetical protein